MPMRRQNTGARASPLAKVLVVDDEHYMRKVVRTLLMSIGVRNIYEAADGLAGLELIRSKAPDVVILDWEMPGLDGAGFVRLRALARHVRRIPTFRSSCCTGHSERSRVMEAMQLGVNEFLLKPVSSKALRERLIAVLANPRPMVTPAATITARRRARIAPAVQDDPSTIAHLILLN